MLIVLPSGVLAYYTFVGSTTGWAGRNALGMLLYSAYGTWLVFSENFKCICLDEEHLWVRMILPRQPDEKRLNFKLGDMAKIREHFFPVVGRVIVIRNADGKQLGVIWISSWKNGRILEQLLAQAVRENGGQFINWKDGLLIFPRMVASWFRPPPEE